MIKIEKDFDDIPKILENDIRKIAFEYNISLNKYDDKSNLYKVQSVQNRLRKLYNDKCAYCEKDIRDEDKHIEHYRPKDRYYWLAYSWDNLLFCCAKCNKNKGIKFEILGSKVEYGNEMFDDIHSLGDKYDKLERPKLINPEKESILDKLIFDDCGSVTSTDDRVSYTIEVVKLDRKELNQKRVKILNNLKKRINDFLIQGNINDSIKNIAREIKYFKDEMKKENEYFAFRYYVLNNIEKFFDDRRLRIILNKIN